jgi:hypothetical protein
LGRKSAHPTWLKKFLKLLTTQVAITKNLGKQARPNYFASVNWHDCRTTIIVVEEMVTTFDAKKHKTSLL